MGCGAFCRGPASPKNQPAVSSSPNLAQLRHPIPLGTKVLGEGGVYSYPAVCPESILPTFIYAFTKVFRPPISQHPGPKSTCSQGRPRRGPRSPGPQCPPGGPKSRGPNPLFLLVLRVWTPGVRGGGKGCVGCSHGSDTGLGGASWGHMESRDEECAPGIEPLPAPSRVWGWGEGDTVRREYVWGDRLQSNHRVVIFFSHLPNPPPTSV